MQLPTDSGLTADLARRMARRLESNPEFLASLFRRYRDAQGFDEARLARHLGVTEHDLAQLAICRRPRVEHDNPARFHDDIESIAEDFDVNPHALAELVRFVDVIDAIAGAPGDAVAAGFLAAAKERAAEDRATYDTDEDEPDENGGDDDPGGPR